MSSSLVLTTPHVIYSKLLIKDNDGEIRNLVKNEGNFFSLEPVIEESSEDSTSENDREGEVQSERKEEDKFGSLHSLQDSLPIKRGLSNFLTGKSKSFTNLADVANASASDIVKNENPFNKRRRILLAFKARRASFSSLDSPNYLPALFSHKNALEECEEEEDGSPDINTSSDKNEEIVMKELHVSSLA